MILKLVEIIFRLFPTEGPRAFAPLFPDIVRAMLTVDELPMVMALHFSLFSRIILQAEDVFDQLLQQEAVSYQNQDPGIPPPSTESFVDNPGKISPELISLTSTEGLLRRLLITWVDKIDVVTQPERRKLAALALAQLMAPNGSKSSVCLQPPVFPAMVAAVVEVLHDVCRSENGNEIDVLVMSANPRPPVRTEDEDEDAPRPSSTSEDSEMETEHDRRKRAVMLADPVHKVSLREFVNSQLGLCQTQMGPDGFQQLLATVDADVVIQLKHFLQ